MSEARSEKPDRSYRPKKKAIFGMALLFFIILGLLAMTLCDFRARFAEQSILNQQAEMQRTWLDKSLDSIRAWRAELVDQARHISTSEMFRLFATDTRNLSPAEIEALADPDSLRSPDESVRAMAEQLTYIQDLLRDFTRRRAWADARILLPNGEPLATQGFSAPLSPESKSLALRAVEKGRAAFGPIKRAESGLVMEMADPLFEVLGTAEPKVVAILLLTTPMDKPLMRFLARDGEGRESLLPRIVFTDNGIPNMALVSGGAVTLEPVATSGTAIASIPFARRKALDGKSDVYSTGGTPTALEWLFVIETPASEVDALIHSQKMQIYGLGILGSLGIALLGAFLWASMASRKHEAEAKRLEKLYTTIRNQKLMLDSVNSSLQAGLALIDAHGHIQMRNPAFMELCGKPADTAQSAPLVEVMPGKAAVKLLQDMVMVNEMGQSACIELTLPDPENSEAEKLYRVTLFPYADSGEGGDTPGGCVAIFQDITEFRRNAERARKRQTALISALGRAIESVDPNLVGHSDKMAGLSELLAGELNMDARDRETLILSARLSQVGKIFLPKELLTKQGKLEPEELRELRRAPEYADRILHDLHFDLPVRETVRMIGERMDGTGKPQGLRGEEISLAGRALAIVNAFIAMTSPRAWRKEGGMGISEALEIMSKDFAFDQDIVAALSRISRKDVAAAAGIREQKEG